MPPSPVALSRTPTPPGDGASAGAEPLCEETSTERTAAAATGGEETPGGSIQISPDAEADKPPVTASRLSICRRFRSGDTFARRSAEAMDHGASNTGMADRVNSRPDRLKAVQAVPSPDMIDDRSSDPVNAPLRRSERISNETSSTR